jgi:hypothetical protein
MAAMFFSGATCKTRCKDVKEFLRDVTEEDSV